MSNRLVTVRLLGALLAVAAIPRLNAQIVIPGLDPQEPLDVRQEMEFGYAVGISGGTAIVGAPGTDGHGAVYVFSRNGSNWTRSAKLLAPDIAPGRFGTQIAYDGTALITDADRQHVYYFIFDGRKWRPRAILRGGISGFGAALAMEGCVALITSSGNTALNQSGFVHMFNRCEGSDGNWRYIKSFTPAGSRPEDKFGTSIALSGTRLMVGAPGWGGGKGAVYYYTYERHNWVLKQRFVQATPQPYDSAFGTQVAFHDRLAVVSEPTSRFDMDLGTQGVAFEFTLASGGWRQIGEIAPPAGTFPWAWFGSKMIVTAEHVLISAPVAVSHQFQTPGSLYIYRRAGASLTLQEIQGGVSSGFGWDFAVSGRSLIVGEPFLFFEPTLYGAAYVGPFPP